MIRLEREVTYRGKTTRTVTYAITSLTRARASAWILLGLLRGRWPIENKAFYVLDVAFGEDACRVRTKTAPQALAALRTTALNFLRRQHLPITQTLREHAYNLQSLLTKLAKRNNPN